MSVDWGTPSESQFQTMHRIKRRFAPFSMKTSICGSLFKNARLAVMTQHTLFAAPLIWPHLRFWRGQLLKRQCKRKKLLIPKSRRL